MWYLEMVGALSVVFMCVDLGVGGATPVSVIVCD